MRISLLVDSPLVVLMHAMRGLDAEVRKDINSQTKAHALAMWQEETRGQVQTRLQSRLAQSASVGVTQQNVLLQAGVGSLSSGTGLATIAKAVEFGMAETRRIDTTSRRGKSYTRRGGSAFGGYRRGGHVAYPAAGEVIPRVAALWIQTAIRRTNLTIEGI